MGEPSELCRRDQTCASQRRAPGESPGEKGEAQNWIGLLFITNTDKCDTVLGPRVCAHACTRKIMYTVVMKMDISYFHQSERWNLF